MYPHRNSESNLSKYVKYSKEIGLVGTTNLLIRLKAFITFPLLTKFLGPEKYGVWMQILATVTFAVPFVYMGLHAGLSRFIPGQQDKQKLRNDFWAASSAILINSLIVITLLYSFSPFLAERFFKSAGSLLALKIALPLITLNALNQVFLNYFLYFGKAKKYLLINIVKEITETGLLFYFLLSGKGIYAVIGIAVFAMTASFIMSFKDIISEVNICVPDFRPLKGYIKYGLPIMFAGFSHALINICDRYSIAYFMDMYSVGIYCSAYNLAVIVIALIAPVHSILYPTVTKLWESNNLEEIKIYLSHSLRYILIIGIPAIVGLSFLSKKLLTVLATSEFSRGWILIPIIGSSLLIFHSVGRVSGFVFNLRKKTMLIAEFMFISAILNLILNFILIPKFGILGAAYATFAAYLVHTVIRYVYSLRYLKFSIDIVSVIKVSFAAAVMAAVISKADFQGKVGLIYSVLSGIAVYSVTLTALGGLKKQDYRLIRDVIAKSNG